MFDFLISDRSPHRGPSFSSQFPADGQFSIFRPKGTSAEYDTRHHREVERNGISRFTAIVHRPILPQPALGISCVFPGCVFLCGLWR